MDPNTVSFSPEEERMHFWTHLLGVLFVLVFGPILIFKGWHSSSLLSGLLVYSITFLGVFVASSLYHREMDLERKKQWRKADHIAIYFFIAGSNTPYLLEYSQGSSGWFFLAGMWSLVFIGLYLKLGFVKVPDWISLIFYLLMGWLGVVTVYLIFDAVMPLTFMLIVAGGILYTIGAYFYSRDINKWFHTIWHVFVLLGALVHFVAIYHQVSSDNLPI